MEHSMPPRRLLITAGPTHEPIDSVRFLGNRSSGTLGSELADAAARAGWHVTLLMGPAPAAPSEPGVRLLRFVSTADLQALLDEHFPSCHVLVMAAAVADYRPVRPAGAQAPEGKIRRGEGRLTLELESTPDLLARCAAARAPGQLLVGFALEPADRLMASAAEKLQRKRIDAIVANPLRTMDAPDIEATFVRADGVSRSTPGAISKRDFAPWLLAQVNDLLLSRAARP
jgi:phosphopantothenoylcysteine decarboxylase/phosphopantothenate--cysteine ligase